MNSPPLLRESPPQTPNREDLPGYVAQSESVASSRPPTPPPGSVTSPQAEVLKGRTKSMEEHAEDLLQDIQKEYLSKTEGQVPPHPPNLKESFLDSRLNATHPCLSVAMLSHPESLPSHSRWNIPSGGNPLHLPLLNIGHHYLTSDAMSISSLTPRSTVENLPASIARSTSFPTSDLDSNEILLEVDPEVDQITKQALGDLIVHSLKLNHNLDANEGWENNDVVRRAITREVDEHARDFLRLAAKLARRMDLIGEPRESTEVPDVEPNQLMAEPILPEATENGYVDTCLLSTALRATEGHRNTK
jgi:hypothetical protein